jgi:hypothetical protein
MSLDIVRNTPNRPENDEVKFPLKLLLPPMHACMIRLVFIHCSFKAKIMKQQLNHVFGGMQLLQESLLRVTGDEDRINPLAPKR